jgi:energy-coupling factor transporter ATP-binding protein EcfA2
MPADAKAEGSVGGAARKGLADDKESKGAPVEPSLHSAMRTAPFALVDVSLKFQPGKLTAVVGPVGSGKTSLISAILVGVAASARLALSGARRAGRNAADHGAARGAREHRLCSTAGVDPEHDVRARTRFARRVHAAMWRVKCECARSRRRVHDNILFGRPLDAQLYEQTIASCALRPDLQNLPSGERRATAATVVSPSRAHWQGTELRSATAESTSVEAKSSAWR